jgi:Flp pilus assembly protein TadG
MNMIRLFRDKVIGLMFKIKRDQRGSVLVLFAAALVMMLGMVALVTDTGALYLEKRYLQNACDSAALAGAQEIYFGSQSSAEAEADDYLMQNNPKVKTSDVKFNGDKSVTVEAGNTVQFSFAKILGITQGDVNARARAKYGPITKVKGGKGVTGVVPLGINEEQERVPGKLYMLKSDSPDYGPGNFGALDLDGIKGGGADDYYDRLLNGYKEELKINDVMLVESGNIAGNTEKSLYTIDKPEKGEVARTIRCNHVPSCTPDNYDPDCARVLIVPVYETIRKNGKAEKLIVKGFAAFLLDEENPEDNGYGKGYVGGYFLNDLKELPEGTEYDVDPTDPDSDFGLRAARLVE